MDRDKDHYELSKRLSPEYYEIEGDVPEVSSYEDYEHLKAKQRASVLWLLSKAYNNEIASELQDPYYKDNEDQDRLKPQIVQALANAELYCLALANIYADPNYSCLNHHGIMQLLMRKGIYVVEPHDTSLTETILVQTAPIRMSAHMVIIEAIMALYIKEVLIPEKVIEVVNRFVLVESEEELPLDAEDAALFWINKSCQKFRQKIEENYDQYENCQDELPFLPPVEDLADLSDGCALASLLSLYCPEHISWTEICFNESMSMADSIYNLQLVQFFCQEKLPYNVCFLSLEDFLYVHQTIRPNMLAFIADLLFLFEIKPGVNVRRPGTKEELGYCDPEDETGGRLYEPDLPTPAEMKAKSLQHTGWVNSECYPPKSKEKRLSRRRKVPSSDHSDDDLTRYFSALDLDHVDQSPDVLMNNSGPQSLLAATAYMDHKVYEPHTLSRSKSGSQRNKEMRQQDIICNESTSGQIEETCSQAGSEASDLDSQCSNRKTSFAKLSKTKDSVVEKCEVAQWCDSRPDAPAINIAFKQKSDKIEKDSLKVKGSSRDNISGLVAQHATLRQQHSLETPVTQRVSSQKTLFQLNDSSLMKQCLVQEAEAPVASPRAASTESIEEDSPENVVHSQLSDIRLKMEKKRQKIEQERKKMEEECKAKRQDISKEAFLRVVKNQKETSDEVQGDLLEKDKPKPVVAQPADALEDSINVSDLKDDLNALKKRFLEAQESPKSNKDNEDSLGYDDIKRSIDLLSTSMTDIEADLDLLKEHRELLKKQAEQQKLPRSTQEPTFFLHNNANYSSANDLSRNESSNYDGAYSFNQPNYESHQQQHFANREPPSLNRAVESSTIPRRGQWGQPVMPVSDGVNNVNQWTTVPTQRPAMDSMHYSGFPTTHPYDISGPPPRLPLTSHPVSSHPASIYGYPEPLYSSITQNQLYSHPNGASHPHGQYPTFSNFAPYSAAGQAYGVQPIVPPVSTNSEPVYSQARFIGCEKSASTTLIPRKNSNESVRHPEFDVAGDTGHSDVRSRCLNASLQDVVSETQKFSTSPSNRSLCMKPYKFANQKRSPTGSPTRSSTISESSSNEARRSNDKLANSSDTSSNRGEDAPLNEKGFFISFGNDNKPKPKPNLRSKPIRTQPKIQESALEANHTSSSKDTVSSLLQNNVQQTLFQKPESAPVSQPQAPGVGFVIGQDLVNPDPMSELEMAKKKELIMIQSLRRKAEQQSKRIAKEKELARKREEERNKRSEMERKKEEERLRKQAILEHYRQRKCQEEVEKNGVSGSASTASSKDSGRNNNTIVLHRLRGRPNSGVGKPRPKSYHVSASQMQEYASLDPRASRITDDIDATYGYGSSMMNNNNNNNNNSNTCINPMPNSSSRPQSAMSGKSGARGRLSSPTARLPSLPSSLLGRHRGPPSDGASDAGSNFSEYTGPKLFVKPTQKSNRGIIMNASNVVLAGAVNNETKRRVLEEINNSESKHFLILFRGAGMQFRGIYSYNPEREEVIKLYGTGPKMVHNDMIDRFYKYNSGSKNFNEVQTKHLTVTIDAFTIHNTLWSGKKMMPNKKDSF